MAPVPTPDTPAGTPAVCCVLLNWNVWQDTVACLESLARQDYPTLRIVVVDNGSTNDSVARIRQAAGQQAEIVETGANLGFAGGCNAGIHRALAMGADFVWLLNSDTIAPPETATRLVAAANAQTGIVGTVLRYMHDPAKLQAWGGGTTSRWTGYVSHFDKPKKLDQDSFFTFASVLIRRAVLEQIGLLDDGFFMYFEDSDFCFRARSAGWQLAVAEDTAVLHKEGGNAHGKKTLAMEQVVTASGLRFLQRHGTAPAISMTLFVLSKLGKRLAMLEFARMRAVLAGVGDWRRRRSAVPSK